MSCCPIKCPCGTQTLDADCGVTLSVSASEYVARVCSQVTFTVVLTNNSEETLQNAVLVCPCHGALALVPNTVTVSGNSIENATPECIPLGEVGPNTSVTITYTCVVMQCQRYISTQACAKFCICCCLNKKSFIVKSEPHTLQVCCCCQGNN